MSAGIAKAIAAIGRGEVVIVTDDEDRENEGDLIMAAEAVTTEKLAFFLEHTSGVICAPLPGERLDELELPLMVQRQPGGAAHGVHGDRRPRRRRSRPGISAADRARTLRGARRPARASPATSSARATSSRCAPPGRRARAGRSHGGRGRPRAAGRAPAGGRAVGGRHAPTGARWRAAPSWRRSPRARAAAW